MESSKTDALGTKRVEATERFCLLKESTNDRNQKDLDALGFISALEKEIIVVMDIHCLLVRLQMPPCFSHPIQPSFCLSIIFAPCLRLHVNRLRFIPSCCPN